MRCPNELESFRRLPLALAMLSISAASGAQSLSLVPTASVTQTLTDNYRLAPSGRAESITQFSPGISLANRGGRVQGFLNYSLNALVYVRDSTANNFQNSLNASMRAEALERWLFVDAAASITQQSISALGRPAGDPGIVNSNSTEVMTWRVSPYVTGSVPGVAVYDLRFGLSGTRGGAANSFDSTVTQASVRLGSDRSLSRLRWNLGASHQLSDFSASRQTQSTRYDAGIGYELSRVFRLTASAGHESSDYASTAAASRNVVSLGLGWTPNPDLDLSFQASRDGVENITLNWSPTVRTRLTAQRARQLYGNTHSLSFEHRMPRSVWRLSDTRSVVSSSGPLATGSRGSTYDLYFTQFASLEPDPVKREQLVNEFLLASGISPAPPAGSGFLTTAASLQRRQEASFALLGVLTTVTFTASSTEGQRLDAVSTVADDLANGNNLRQRSFSVAVAHRLTPISSVNLAGTTQKSSASVSGQQSELRSLNLTWASRLTRNGNATITLRRAEFDSPLSPYNENAVVATLGWRF